MSKKKMILSILLSLLIVIVTFYAVFSKTSPQTIIDNLKLMKLSYIGICAILIILYFLCQGIYMEYILKSMGVKITTLKGFYYAAVEFFFSGITISSTGGQPMQLYYMKKDDIPVSKSAVVLLLDTIYFKLYLILMGIIILIFAPDLVFNHCTSTIILFFLGLAVDLFVNFECLLLMYNQKLIKAIVKIFYIIVGKFKKDTSSLEDKINSSLDAYKNETSYVKSHMKEVIVGFILTFFQRTFMFSIAYVIYRAFGFSEYTYVDLLLIQTCAWICIEGLPLPGGTGGSEYITEILYKNIFGVTLATTGMVLTRIFSFYLPILVICIMVLIVTKVFYIDKNKMNLNKIKR